VQKGLTTSQEPYRKKGKTAEFSGYGNEGGLVPREKNEEDRGKRGLPYLITSAYHRRNQKRISPKETKDGEETLELSWGGKKNQKSTRRITSTAHGDAKETG